MCFIHDINYNRVCSNCGKRAIEIYDNNELFVKRENTNMTKDVSNEELRAELERLKLELLAKSENVPFKVRLQNFLKWVWPTEKTSEGNPHTHGSRFFWFMMLSWFVVNISRATYMLPKVALYGFSAYAAIIALCCFVDWLNDFDWQAKFDGWFIRGTIIFFGVISTLINLFMFIDSHSNRRAYE